MTAVETLGPSLEHHQLVLASVSDLLMEAFSLESVVARNRQLEAAARWRTAVESLHRGESSPGAAVGAAGVRLGARGRRALEGDDARPRTAEDSRREPRSDARGDRGSGRSGARLSVVTSRVDRSEALCL